jgi:exopolysaccharide biosynthesis polyprenyl glycosylphosphotransferase
LADGRLHAAATQEASFRAVGLPGMFNFELPATSASESVSAPSSRFALTVGYGRREWALRRLLAASDCLAILLSLTLAGLVSGRGDLPRLLGFAVLTLPFWGALIRAYGLYDRDPKRISCSTVDDIPGIFHAVFIGSVLLWGYFRLVPVRSFGLAELLVFAASAVAAMLAGRATARHRMRRRGERRALIVGQGPTSRLLARKLASHPEYGFRLVGALDGAGVSVPAALAKQGAGSAEPARRDALPALPLVGSTAELEQVTERWRVDRLIVDSHAVAEPELIELLRRCRRIGLRVSVLPQIFDVMGPSVEIDDVEGVTVLGLDPPVLSRSSRALKRSMDLLGSLAFLLLTLPLLIAIAIAIKLDSRGPVLFVQSRVGRDGAPLRVWKFRTMVRDAEQRRSALLAQSEDPDWLKLEADPRITRVGRWLRLTSLDELPQLFNVLRGEMSLVGPRPLIADEAARVADWGRARLDLTPGITGLWQVLGRTSIPFEEMVKLDYLYVTNWSLWSDVRVLLHTLPAVLTRRGAN